MGRLSTTGDLRFIVIYLKLQDDYTYAKLFTIVCTRAETRRHLRRTLRRQRFDALQQHVLDYHLLPTVLAAVVMVVYDALVILVRCSRTTRSHRGLRRAADLAHLVLFDQETGRFEAVVIRADPLRLVLLQHHRQWFE